MEGRQGQGSNGKRPLDRSATGEYRISERLERYRETGTTGAYHLSDLAGKQPGLPPRPSGSARMDLPPPMPRVARPQTRRERKPRTWKWWLGASLFSLVALILLSMLVYGASNLFFALTVNYGAANAATDFLASLKDTNYDQAYNDLSPNMTASLGRSDFTQMAQADDRCDGPITGYSEVDGSAITAPDGSQSFTYAITRSKLSQPYQMQLTLRKNAAGDWSVISFGDDLGPAPPTCA